MNPLRLDLRSLSLFRLGLGILLLIDLYCRILVIPDFYVDESLVPRGPLLTEFANPHFFSVFNMAGKSFYIYLLSFFAGLSYLSFAVGFKTRFFAVLAWVFFASFTARAPIAVPRGDDLIRMALFWILFLPTNAYYSVDSALDTSKNPKPQSLFNAASFAFMMQLLIVYFFTALLKRHPIWTEQGSALFYALELDQFLTTFGTYFKMLPLWVLKSLTHLTFWTELLVPFLVLIPWKNPFFRWVAILTFASFHFGLFLVLKLGTFPWICMIYWLAFIPSQFWDSFENKLRRIQSNFVIYYDADCGYCLKMVYLIKTFLILPFIEVRKAQDRQDTFEIMKKEDSWIVEGPSSKKFTTRYEAFLSLLQASPLRKLKKIFGFSFLRRCGDSLYRYQAKRRPYFGNLLRDLRFQDLNLKSPVFVQIFVAGAFLIAFYWNIALFKSDDKWVLNPTINKVGAVLRLHQQWNMFSPFPAFEDGWLVVEGQLLNGKTWDVFYDQEFTTEKPKSVADTYNGVFWRKYISNVIQLKYENHRLYLGRHICRRWNTKHSGDDRVNTFKVFFMMEKSTSPGGPVPIAEKQLIWDHYCFEKPPTQ